MKLTASQIKEVIATKLPDNTVVPEHDDYGHFYRDTRVNERYASVTTKTGILDMPHLKKWAASEAVKLIDKNLHIITHPDVKRDKVEEIYKAAVMAHNDILQDAGDIGTQGHEAIEEYLGKWMEHGEQPADIRSFIRGTDYRLAAITRSAEQFCRDFNVVPLASELRVASNRFKYAGTLDSLMMIPRIIKVGDKNDVRASKVKCGHRWWNYTSRNPNREQCDWCGARREWELTLVDWKTSNSVDKPEYAMQGAAYWYALKEMTGLAPTDIIIVRLDKTQMKYDVVRISNRVEAFRAFKHVCKVYDWLASSSKKVVPLYPKTKIYV